jgi:hypothetical protein
MFLEQQQEVFSIDGEGAAQHEVVSQLISVKL